MKLQTSMSPNLIKLVIAGAALIGVLTLWNGIKSRIISWSYEPIYGEQNHEAVAPVREELYSLPIVIAKSEDSSESQADDITDADIEAAFRAPEPVVEEEVAAAPVMSLTQQFKAVYRPVVNAISGGGAFINGKFWSVGEAIVAMPIRSRDGQLVTPVIVSISNSGVSLRLDQEQITLPFSGY